MQKNTKSSAKIYQNNEKKNYQQTTKLYQTVQKSTKIFLKCTKIIEKIQQNNAKFYQIVKQLTKIMEKCSITHTNQYIQGVPKKSNDSKWL